MAPDNILTDQLLQSIADVQLRPCAVSLDETMQIRAVTGHADWYGYSELKAGDDGLEVFPFLYGVEAGPALEWPLMETPSGKAADIRLLTAQRPWLLVLTDASRLHDEQQAVQQIANEARILGYRKDQLTEELRKAKEEIEEKRRIAEEANQLKSGFIATMSHEFRTPLSSILGYTNLLLERASEENQQEVIAVRRGAQHLLDLVSALLDQGQIDSGSLKLHITDCDLHELMEDVEAIFKPLAERKGLTLQIIRNGLPGNVRTDTTRLRQILVNLLGNAIKFTDRGKVVMTAQHVSGQLHIAIQDSGPGIPDEQLQQIFVPFQRVEGEKKQGAGLGLAISRRLAELMGGSLDVKSTLGEGSCFELSIAAEFAAPADPQSAIKPKNLQGRSVLLIEDDEDIAALISLHLDDTGLKTLHAADLAAAVDFMTQIQPDAIITDMNLPDAQGAEILNRLRSSRYTGPLIVLTASESPEQETMAIQAGCEAFLHKPVDFPLLISTVDALIDSA